MLTFSPPADSQAEQTVVRLPASATPVSGSSSAQETEAPQTHPSGDNTPQDEVKVQMEPPGEIAVYKFLDQNGSLVLQVPPQQVLELAQAISQEFAQESSSQKAAKSEGAENDGH